MRIGIVGLGSIARRVYLPMLCNRSDLDVVGLVSRSAETVARVGQAYRISGTFTDLDDLLKSGPDLVFVHAPTLVHPEIVSACLAAGTGVYVDKPLAYTFAECAELADRAERAGRLVAVGFNRRFAPMYVRARTWIAEHGRAVQVAMEKHRATAPMQSIREAVFDDLIHVLDTITWLLGPQIELFASDIRAGPDRGFRQAVGLVRSEDACGSLAMARSVGADLERLAVHGVGHSAEVVDLERAMLDGPGGRLVAGFGSWDTVVERRGFAALVEHVLDTADTPARCEVSAQSVLPTHRLAEGLVAEAARSCGG
jgi:virulence factor